MIDQKKVIKAWEIFRDSNPYGICEGKEFMAINEPEYCMGQMIEDTIALLKEQEAVKPETENAVYDIGTWWYICGACKNPIDKTDVFCRHCGRPVKWE